MSKIELLIIADDVTGAADSAARCRQARLTAAIDLFPAAGAHLPQILSTTVLALSTDSRFLLPQVAADRVAEIVGNFARHLALIAPTDQPPRWYKKIDSTLRGNIGAELTAMLPLVTPNGSTAQAIIAPAFPAQQRTLVDGYLRFAQFPPRALHLPTLLAEQCDLSVATISLATVRAGLDALQQALMVAKAAATLIVVDAESEEDLERLTIATLRTLPHALFCGSAGLVGVLAGQMAIQLGLQSTDPTTSHPTVGPDFEQSFSDSASITERADRHHLLLAVVGSGSTVAQQQVAHLRGISAVTVWEVDPDIPSAVVVQRLEEAIATARDREYQQAIALHLPIPSAGVPLEGPLARQYAAALADIALELIARHQPATIVIVGGDTAIHLLQRMGIRQLSIVEELLPGMPVTVGQDSQGKKQQIILKAGNHGDVVTLATLLRLV